MKELRKIAKKLCLVVKNSEKKKGIIQRILDKNNAKFNIVNLDSEDEEKEEVQPKHKRSKKLKVKRRLVFDEDPLSNTVIVPPKREGE